MHDVAEKKGMYGRYSPDCGRSILKATAFSTANDEINFYKKAFSLDYFIYFRRSLLKLSLTV